MDKIIKALLIVIFFVPNCFSSDFFELSSRRELTRLALDQTAKISHEWDPSQLDCSGFVRFLYRKAVFRGHDSFRSKDGKEVSYLSAKDLINYNFRFLTKTNYELARSGDILVFYRDGLRINNSWHLMVVVNDLLNRNPRKLLIYHTGSNTGQSAMKKVWLDELKSIEAGAFRPIKENPNYLGIYRWNGYEKN